MPAQGAAKKPAKIIILHEFSKYHFFEGAFGLGYSILE
jgi:hypothetical protein